MDGFSKDRSCRLLAHPTDTYQTNELMPIIQTFSISKMLIQPLTISISQSGYPVPHPLSLWKVREQALLWW